MNNTERGDNEMPDIRNDVLKYTELELVKIDRELTDEENAQREDIKERLGLSHEQIIEKGKDSLLS